MYVMSKHVSATMLNGNVYPIVTAFMAIYNYEDIMGAKQHRTPLKIRFVHLERNL